MSHLPKCAHKVSSDLAKPDTNLWSNSRNSKPKIYGPTVEIPISLLLPTTIISQWQNDSVSNTSKWSETEAMEKKSEALEERNTARMSASELERRLKSYNKQYIDNIKAMAVTSNPIFGEV